MGIVSKFIFQVTSILILIGVYQYYHLVVRKIKDERYIREALETIFKLQGENLGILKENNKETQRECMLRDYRKYIHPDTVLEDFFIYRRQSNNDSVRLTIRDQFFDAQPWHETFQGKPLVHHLEKQYSRYTTLFMNANSYNRATQETKYCLFEKYMHFPDPQSLTDKVTIAKYMNKRIDKLNSMNISQQCLRDAQFQKKSYILDYPNECEEFFKKVNVEYAVNGTGEVYNYVKKTNQHDQKGTELAFRAVMSIYQDMYDYGNNCSQPPRKIIMQEYIRNPLLFEGRKFDIRLHTVVVSTNPLIVYLYKRFYLMKCSYPFDHNEFRNQSHICSAGYQRRMHKIYDKQKNTKEYEKTLPLSQITEQVSYEEFADKIIAEGLIKDRSWIDTYMIPEMERKFYHYYQSYFDQEGQINDPRFGGYSACEFDVDDQLNFWLLECTPCPNLVPQAGQNTMKSFQMGLHSHGLPLLIQYQRQRYLKIKNFVTDLTDQIKKIGLEKVKAPRQGLRDRIKLLLREEVITDPQIDNYFHRIDFKRASQFCN